MRDTAPKTMRVIAGPARCGKSRRIVETFAKSRRERRNPLVIVPDAASGAAMRRRVLSELPAFPTDAVSTFVGLAEHILGDSGASVRLIGSHDREMLLRLVVHELVQEGRLRHFRSAAAHDGFYPQLASFIRELKSCQVKPADFRAAAGGPANREISDIYQRYQDALEKSSLYDSEGRFWQARLALEERRPDTMLYDDVFIDGFTDFTPNELSLLKSLSRHVGTLVVTLPYDPVRSELFAKTCDTLNNRLPRDYDVEVELMPAAAPDSVCRVLAASLFAPLPPEARFSSGAALTFVSTSGVRMEFEEIAREAKRLIAAGRDPRQIAVVVRSLASSADAAVDAFRRAGVPLDAPTPLDFARSPLLYLLLSLVRLASDDFERETVLGVLLSPYVDLASLSTAVDPGDVRRLIISSGAVKGRAQLIARLAGLEAAAEQISDGELDEDDSRASRISSSDVPALKGLSAAVARLGEIVMPFEKPSPASTFARSFAEALEALGARKRVLDADVPEDVLFHDLAAWTALTDALASVGRSAHNRAPMTARAFLRLVALAVGESASSGDLRRPGVALLDVATARNLSFPVVFFSGVLADVYPAAAPVNPLHSRCERDEMAKLGLVIRSEKGHLDAERLLFYQAVTRADESLYITWPATDESGKPLLSSFYLEDVRALFAVDPLRDRRFGPSRVFVPREDASSPGEVSFAVIRGMADAESAEEVESLAAVAVAAGLDCRRALRAATVEARRDLVEDCDSFEARLGPDAAAAVAARFPKGNAWSGSSLGDYRKCPFVFFLNRVLGAERPVKPDVVPEPVERGLFAHEFLARFFSSVAKRGELAKLLNGDVALLERSFSEAFERIAVSRGKKANLADDPFWEIEVERLRRILSDFVKSEIERLAKAKGKYTPASFEVPFGPLRHRVSGSAAPPEVSVEKNGRREYLCGRIDRVDLVEGDTPGGVSVVDYKLSRKPSRSEVASFVDMQMPLYLYAAPKAVKSVNRSVPVAGFYRTIQRPAGSQPVVSLTSDHDREAFFAGFAAEVFRCADGVRGGVFAAMPAVKCPPFCVGGGVCRLNQVRIDLMAGTWDDDET